MSTMQAVWNAPAPRPATRRPPAGSQAVVRLHSLRSRGRVGALSEGILGFAGPLG